MMIERPRVKISENFGGTVLMSRTAIGKEPDVVAQRAGISVETLNNLEQGQVHTLSVDTIDRLADSLFVLSSPERLIPAQSIIMRQKEIIVNLTDRITQLRNKTPHR
jgi:transcriptional regulator with XRE-family HTH domain